MGVTAFSFVLLPLCLFWCLNPQRLLQTLFLAGIFEAAAAVTLGGVGVQPGLVPAMVFAGYVMLQLLLGARYPGQDRALRLCAPLLLVGIWALLASWLMPHVFEGRVWVWPQKSTPPFVISLLEPTSSNLNQDFYLLLNLVVLALAALFLTISEQLRLRVFRAFMLSGFLAAAVGVWQFAARTVHVPFPDALLYSNPGWSILTAQSMGAIPRINGSFAEPSSFGSYMAMCCCSSGWLMLRGHRDRLIRPLFATGVIGVMLSTSTTGIASLGIAAAGVALGSLFAGSSRILSALARVGLPILIFVGLLGLLALALAPHLFDALDVIFSSTLNKQSSESYDARTSTDLDSLQAVLDTYGLGVGWGSDRSSSLIPGLLAGVGVPGMLGIIAFGVRLGFSVARNGRGASPARRMVMDGTVAAIVGALIPACLSAPTITSVSFFVLLALLIANCAAPTAAPTAVRRAPGTPARSPATG